MIKLDLQKAYDTMDWDFSEEMLYSLKFPEKFIRKGIEARQSNVPFPFCIWDGVSQSNHEQDWEERDFGYHERCAKMKLNHLSFADDVLLFCRGKSVMAGAGSVTWESLCNPKKEGGLGLLNVAKWNVATMFKQVWAVANKDNLWVKWVHCVYIKHHNWWEYKAPQSSNWY
uniref:Reverse transcriptase domain-containing protein n=1 Tax=Cannabis sativa TaxID=3483 RepID=A0A803NIW5_CANSA